MHEHLGVEGNKLEGSLVVKNNRQGNLVGAVRISLPLRNRCTWLAIPSFLLCMFLCECVCLYVCLSVHLCARSLTCTQEFLDGALSSSSPLKMYLASKAFILLGLFVCCMFVCLIVYLFMCKSFLPVSTGEQILDEACSELSKDSGCI